MVEEPQKFVGTYISESLYFRFKLKCAKKATNASKALMELIMIFCKDTKLSEIDGNVIEEKAAITNAETKSD